MLVVTPTNAGMADRKPKVISGLKKSHVQRSPSLDGLPRLSGILNQYSDSEIAWHLRWVVVRDGSLLVYSPDVKPGAQAQGWQGCATLSRLETTTNFPAATVTASNDGLLMQSLDSSSLRNHLLNDGVRDDQFRKDIAETDSPAKADTYRSRKNLDQMLRRDQAIFDSAMMPFSTNSLDRQGGASCARLPLRHLNLRPCDLRPLAFSLSRRVEDGETCTVATFQAPSRRDYERWVKTLAVEILRQTPLDAVRFLDILGIVDDDNKSKCDTRSKSRDQVDSSDHTPLRPARMSRKSMFTNGDSIVVKKPETPKKPIFKMNSFDRSRSGSIKKHRTSPRNERSKNNGSFRKKDRDNEKQNASNNNETDVRQNVARNLFDEKYRVPILTCQSIVNHNNVTTVTIRELKDIRGREVFTPPCSREADIHTDEGIVVEISDDDFSSESDLKTNRLSEHSNCLDSPKSVTSQSSFGDSLTNSIDCVDSFDDRIIKINIPHAVSISKRKKEELNKRRTEADRKNEQKIEKGENNWGKAPWAGCILKPAGIDQLLAKDKADVAPFKVDIGKSTQIFSGRWSWENSAIYNQMSCPDRMFLRARSCSPNKAASNIPRRYAMSCSRPTRVSTGHIEENAEMVQLLKMRCQSTDKYVPVKDKLTLFETLSQMERRLAKSSEDLLDKTSDSLPIFSKRAQSMHDLSKPEMSSVPVKEICKFFENISKDKFKSPSVLVKSNNKHYKSDELKYGNDFNGYKNNNFDSCERPKAKFLKSNILKFSNMKNKIESSTFDRLNYLMYKQIKHGNKIISFV